MEQNNNEIPKQLPIVDETITTNGVFITFAPPTGEVEPNETPQQLPIEDQMPESMAHTSDEDWFPQVKQEPQGKPSWDDFSPEPQGEPQSEPKQEPQTDERRELTYGERLVGITFNPSNNKDVDRVKRLCAELADIAQKYHFNGKNEISHLHNQLYNHTFGEILNAQMSVVKLITNKY